MRRSTVAMVVVGAAMLGVAACGQILGIQDVHDDPPDATATKDSSTPDAPGAVDTGADARIPGDAPTGTDASDASPADAPFLDAPDGPDPSLGCPAVDGGTLFFKAGTQLFRFTVDRNYFYAAPATGIVRCSIEGCSGPPVQITQDTVDDLTSNDRHVVWVRGGGAPNLVVATPDGVEIGGRMIGASGPTAAAGDDVWAFSASTLWHIVDSPAGFDSGVPPEIFGVGIPDGLVAASPSYVAFAQDVDSGSDFYVCPRSGCADAGPMLHLDTPVKRAPPVAIGLDDQNLYVGDPVSLALEVCPVGGCASTPQVVTPSASVYALSVTASSVVWGGTGPDGEGIYMLAPDGGGSVFVAPSQGLPQQVIATDRCIYWSLINYVAPMSARVFAIPLP